MPDRVDFEPRPPPSSGGIVPVSEGGTGADLSNAAQARVLATPPNASGPIALRSLTAPYLPAVSPSPAGTFTYMTAEVDQYGRVLSASSGSPPNLQTQSLSPPGGFVWFSAELFLGPTGSGYSYNPGGAGYLPGCVFDSTLVHWLFRTVPAAVNLTVRLRTSSGVEVYSKVLTAGQSLVDEAVSIAVAHDVLLQLSVEPASGIPSIDAWSFGWVRRVSV